MSFHASPTAEMAHLPQNKRSQYALCSGRVTIVACLLFLFPFHIGGTIGHTRLDEDTVLMVSPVASLLRCSSWCLCRLFWDPLLSWDPRLSREPVLSWDPRLSWVPVLSCVLSGSFGLCFRGATGVRGTTIDATQMFWPVRRLFTLPPPPAAPVALLPRSPVLDGTFPLSSTFSLAFTL